VTEEPSLRSGRRISVVVDNDSWIQPWAEQLVQRCRDELGDDAVLLRSYDEICEGLAAIFMGCLGIAPKHILARNQHNLVPHASALPHGRGFAPLAWQIIEGYDQIPVSLIEAAEGPDEGPIYCQTVVHFAGHELHDELRAGVGAACVELCMQFLASDELLKLTPQSGKPSWYRRRTPADSELDPGQPLAEQFDLLRTVDNERYPAYFRYRGHVYRLKIEKADDRAAHRHTTDKGDGE